MKYLSLFSGIGAFEKALDRLEIPYELIGFSEIDKYAVKSYCAIHGVDESKNLGDITKIDEKALPKDIDLITYGFPCQDISISGKMRGLFNEDGTQTRSGLFFEALRIIEETQPKVAIAENVKNLVGKKFSEQFKIVLESLEQAGYNNYWQVLNAKDFGVPHNRERVFIVSIRKDIDTGFFKFPEGFPLELRMADILEYEVDEKYFITDYTVLEIANEHQLNLRGGKWDKIHESARRVYSENYISPTLPTCQGGNIDRKVFFGKPAINKISIPQTVKVRKYEVDCNLLCECLRDHKHESNFSNKEIAETLDVPLTKVEHWFRKDIYFAIPDAEIWLQLKELLGIETDEFDESIMTFEEKEGVFEQSERYYFTDGIAPTLTSATAGKEKFIVAAAMRGRYNEDGQIEQHIEVSDREYANAITTVQKDSLVSDSLQIRKLTEKEMFRLLDFDDEDFEKAKTLNSNTQLKKQAGNSIVVAVPYYIIKALIEANIFIEKESKEMELKVNEVQLPEQILFNYEELKQELTERVSMYETMVYTDEQIKEAKKDKANLNKLKKALNDERIRREKEYMQPFNDFKAKINEIISIIDKPVAVIDKQVKAYEEKQQQEKESKIHYMIDETIGEGSEMGWLEHKQIFNSKWLNVSVSMKSIQEAITERVEQIKNDLATLENLPEFGFEAIEVYKSTLDVNKAINEARRMSEIAKAKSEYEARERAKAEEQARIEKEAKTMPVTPIGQAIESIERQAFENCMNPPVSEEPAKQWVSFSAFLSTDDALALREFFNSRSIEFKAI